jgi:GT2 family glycosyltransferase
MTFLRLTGLILAIVGFAAVTFLRIKARRLSNRDFLIGTALSAALLGTSLYPEKLTTLLAYFSFEKGGGGRLIGLLIISTFVLFVLLFNAFSRIQANENAMSRMVYELAKRNYLMSFKDPLAAPICVVIPAYNEAENISSVLEQIPPEVDAMAISTIVVVDGATDNTEEVVEGLSHRSITHIINRGGGAAIRAGCDMAIQHGAEIIVTLDADGQHLASEIPIIVRPILEGRADLVNGSRVLGAYEKDSRLRALGVKLFNWLISLLAFQHVTDCSNAFRAIRAQDYLRLDLRQAQYHTSEMLLEAIKKGLRVIEVPITIKTRLSGESKKGPSWKYSWGFFRAMLSTWLR